jgi:pSer/pThr/pTyr-binding forkhead associated (FHA) protein
MTSFPNHASHLQAILKNLSSTNPTRVNDVPIGENEHHLEHGDVITTGER